mgnify:CR=1 FL=1
MGQLEDYVKQQLQAGYSVQQIKLGLRHFGYNPRQIEGAISTVQKQASPLNRQYITQLKQYINQQINSGFNLAQVKQALNNYGYDPVYVEQAVSEIKGSTSKETHKLLLPLSVAVLLIIVAGGIFLVTINSGNDPIQPQQLDISVRTFTDRLNINELLRFSINLNNYGSENRYDVHLNFILVNSNSGKTHNLGNKVVSIETQLSSVEEFSLPSDLKPGWYEVKTSVNYNNLYDYAKSGSFYVENPGFRQEKPEPDNNETVKKNPTKNTTTEKKDYNNLNMIEIMNNIEKIAEQSPVKAEQLCDKIDYNMYRNDCFLKAAKKVQNVALCKKINSENLKDRCLTQISTKDKTDQGCAGIENQARRDLCFSDLAESSKNFSYCDNIESKTLRQSCESLGHFEETKNKDYSNITINATNQSST